MAVRERKLPRARRYVAARRGALTHRRGCNAARHARLASIIGGERARQLPASRAIAYLIKTEVRRFSARELNRKTLPLRPPDNSHYAFSLARLVWLVGRCYGRRSRVVAPPCITSLTLTRASASARFAYATRRDETRRERGDAVRPASPRLTRVRPSARLGTRINGPRRAPSTLSSSSARSSPFPCPWRSRI